MSSPLERSQKATHPFPVSYLSVCEIWRTDITTKVNDVLESTGSLRWIVHFMIPSPMEKTRQSPRTRALSSILCANPGSWNEHPEMPRTKQPKKVGASEPWLLAPGAATGSRLRDENYFENQGQRPQAYICSRLLTRGCHGPSQSESNFINTVIKQKGNYFKYWKNVRVIHEFCGYHILFDTQWINDSK